MSRPVEIAGRSSMRCGLTRKPSTIVGIALGALSLFVQLAPAHAQEKAHGFGTKGQLIFSAERLVPLFAYQNTKFTQNGSTVSDSTSTTLISLLPNVNATGVDGTPNFYNIPRLAFDYTVTNGLTLGGSIYAAFTPGASVEHRDNGTAFSTDAAKATLFGIAPRIGYILGLSEIFAFWPRGGFTYATLSTKNPDNDRNGDTTTRTSNQLAINLEAQFALVPVPHFFFFLGPVVDIPLTGTAKTEQVRGGVTTATSRDLSLFHLGITAGLGGYIGG